MRLTQGTFSFLPDLTDEQIAAQIRYALDHGWAISVEYTDDPHPRNAYWEMWGLPLFDLEPRRPSGRCGRSAACREAHPDHYVKVIAYDASRGRQTTALSFIVNRRAEEPGFRLERTDATTASRISLRACMTLRAARNARPPRRAGATVPQAGRLAIGSRARAGAAGTPRRARADARGGPESTAMATRPIRANVDIRARRTSGGARPARPRADRARAGQDADPRDRRAARRSTGCAGGAASAPSARRCTCPSRATRAPARRRSRCGWPRSCTASATSPSSHVVAVTRDDLVGQYVGHTAPKTKEVLKRAYGGVLFIDEAYYLYRPENERDYGAEAIEILLQVMENERDKLVVIFAGYKDRMDEFFRLNPGMSLARRAPHRLPRLRRRRADGDRAS